MDFHPNMLGRQGMPQNAARPNHGAQGFHPNHLSQQRLAGLEDVPPGSQLPGGVRLDLASGIIWIGDSPVKLVPAIVSALAIKLIFFGGNKVAGAAKHVAKKIRSGGTAATNPRKPESAKPWQAVIFGQGWKRLRVAEHATRAAADAWISEQMGDPELTVTGSRVSYIG